MFFGLEENRVKLEKELESWEGTPYRHRSGVKNRGVDCIHFVAVSLVNLGAIQVPVIPDYPPDWHLHQAREWLRDEIIEQLPVKEVGFAGPMDGDVILFKFGKAASHSGFFCGGYLYHSVLGIGYQKTNWLDPLWHDRKRFGFRVI